VAGELDPLPLDLARTCATSVISSSSHLFFEKAGPYANLKPHEAQRLLAERMGTVTKAEHAKWIQTRQGETTLG
jgi:hypothetical protein